MKGRLEKAIINFSNFSYIAGCSVLYLIAISILVSSVWSILNDMISGSYTVYKVLDEVGLIVFSMAVVDVGKYLMIEEVLQKGVAKQVPSQSRKTLTKFTIIIASALSLEGLVLTIEVAKEDVSKIFYPLFVVLTATIYIVAVAIYQKLNANSEKGV